MLMHLTMEDLTALRDGTGSAAARRHVQECAACAAELHRLEQRVAMLKALPALRPPRDRWPVVRAELARERRQRRRLLGGWVAVAVAASLVVTLGAHNMVQRQRLDAERQRLSALVEQSRQLDDMLSNIDMRGRAITGREASAIIDLENRLADIDQRLAGHRSAQPSSNVMNLWRQRVQVQDALVGVHVSKAAYGM
jgi:hypothetical protein